MSATQHDFSPEWSASRPDATAKADTRRNFVMALAKVAMVPAVIAGVAANTDPAHAR